MRQVTGEAQYTDDVPLPPNVLHAALVTSTRPHAKILSVDASAAEQVNPSAHSRLSLLQWGSRRPYNLHTFLVSDITVDVLTVEGRM